MPKECDRTRLIGEIARLLAVERMPDDTRTAALTLIGWLARRMPGECAHALGVEEARTRSVAARRLAGAAGGPGASLQGSSLQGSSLQGSSLQGSSLQVASRARRPRRSV